MPLIKIPTLLRRKEFEFILAIVAILALFTMTFVSLKYAKDLYYYKHNIHEVKYTM